jgi:M6 family metalloprotease-like protein
VKGAPWLVTLVVAGVLSLLTSVASGSAPTVTGPQLMPAHPDLLARIAAEGYDSVTVVDLARLAELKRQQGIDQLEPPAAPVIGTRPAVVLLVEYSDLAHNPTSTSASYQNLLFSVGTLVPGSLRDFYQSNSYSQFDISPWAVDSVWRLTGQAHTYYANNDGIASTADDYGFGAWPNNAQKLVADAVALADPYLNFASYAVAGQVQGLFVVHAGPGAEVTANPSDIWSHAWALGAYAVTVDGVTVNAYSMEPEYIVTAGDSTVGVFCHEYGHVLGLPDLYDTDYSSMGIGAWSVMAGGVWNGTNGNSPAYLDAWSRAFLGWVTPTVVTGAVSGASLPAAESSSTVYRLWTNGATGTEYFLLENRQRIAGNFDNALPGDGLLLYHIDENASQNTDWHPRVMIEQADGLWDLQYNVNAGDAGDPYPGTSNNRTANASTVPNTRSYAGSVTYVTMANVSSSALTMTADLAVATTPTADFTGAPTSGYAPLNVYFTDTSLDLPTSWSWSFGDGGTSTAQHPSHTYASAGSYTVSLTATNGAGSDTETKSNYITSSVRPPTADFTGTPTSGYVPLDVQFTDTSSYSPTSWSWTFGDGGTSTAQHPTHQYASVGTYDVSLTATNGGGSDTETKPGYVTAAPLPAPPVADFTGTPTSGPAPLTVAFTDQSTGLVDAWAWGFGDGAVADVQHPSHVYTAPGSYDVSLTTSNAGGSDTEAKAGYIIVLPDPPAAEFSAAPSMGVVPLQVSFSDASAGDPTGWAWDFGDGATATAQHPGHEYAEVGTYTVSLTASNAGGSDTATKARYILVTFPDVPCEPEEHWALREILACVDAGIVQGYPGGNYGPLDAVTRGQMAVYIGRAIATPTGDEGVPEPDTGTQSFTDVDATHWAYRYVEYCYANDLVQGYPSGAYHPDEVVNRGQMAVYMSRAVAGGDEAVPEHIGGATFDDVTEANDWAWCYRHVEYCAAQGIVQGYWDGTYRPANDVTRDQMAVYVARAFELPM